LIAVARGAVGGTGAGLARLTLVGVLEDHALGRIVGRRIRLRTGVVAAGGKTAAADGFRRAGQAQQQGCREHQTGDRDRISHDSAFARLTGLIFYEPTRGREAELTLFGAPRSSEIR
jgi:hypothetical protein